jgi:hypothetical protein
MLRHVKRLLIVETVDDIGEGLPSLCVIVREWWRADVEAWTKEPKDGGWTIAVSTWGCRQASVHAMMEVKTVESRQWSDQVKARVRALGDWVVKGENGIYWHHGEGVAATQFPVGLLVWDSKLQATGLSSLSLKTRGRSWGSTWHHRRACVGGEVPSWRALLDAWNPTWTISPPWIIGVSGKISIGSLGICNSLINKDSGCLWKLSLPPKFISLG